MSRVGDTPWVCPSCGNHLGGYKRGSKGAVVFTHGKLVNTLGGERSVDIVACNDCGVIFAVDETTVPKD